MKCNVLIPFTMATMLCFMPLFSQVKGVTIKNRNEVDTTKVNINSTFLLLGTLNDYINHKYVTKQNQFDRYYDYEKPLMAYVDSVAKKDFKVVFSVEKNCFISEKLTKKMDSLYVGNRINDSLFTNIEKKLSFILGVYLRNGEKINDDIYKIQLASAPKHQNVYELLKQLYCRNIYYKRLDNYPKQYILYFQATDLMKKYLATIATQKEQLLDSKMHAMRVSEEVQRQYKAITQKDHQKIIELFK